MQAQTVLFPQLYPSFERASKTVQLALKHPLASEPVVAKLVEGSKCNGVRLQTIPTHCQANGRSTHESKTNNPSNPKNPTTNPKTP